MEQRIKLFWFLSVNKKQFYLLYGSMSVIFISLTVYFSSIEIPVDSNSSKFIQFMAGYFNLFWFVMFLLTVIEGQFYWNKFTRAQMKLIAEQKEEIEAQAENLLMKNEEINLQNMIIQAKNQHINDSINYAKKIQKAVFKLSESDKHIGQEFSILLKPRDIVSGDFYWIKKVGNKSVFVGADCTGHGVPGAFMSMLGISYLNQLLQEGTERKKEVTQKEHSKIGIYYEYIEAEDHLIYGPAQLLEKLREKIKMALHQSDFESDAKDGMDMGVCVFDAGTYQLKYAGAHWPLLYYSNGQLFEVRADRMPVGVHPKEKPFNEHIIQMEKGDRFYLFSDGLTDQFGGPDNEKFKINRLIEIIQNNVTESVNRQVAIVQDEFEKWKQHSAQLDDVLFLAVEV